MVATFPKLCYYVVELKKIFQKCYKKITFINSFTGVNNNNEKENPCFNVNSNDWQRAGYDCQCGENDR